MSTPGSQSLVSREWGGEGHQERMGGGSVLKMKVLTTYLDLTFLFLSFSPFHR